MTNSQAASRTRIWSVPQCPFVIEYELAVLEAINLQVIEGHHALHHGGLEVGGFLSGAFDGERMRIRGYEPFHSEHAQGPSFILSETDKASLAERIHQFQSRAEGGQRILGWYHSHTRSGLALSTEDVSAHEDLFREPWQVALLLTPLDWQSCRAGFFFRAPGATALPASPSFQEFVVEGAALVRRDPVEVLAPERGLRSPASAIAQHRAADTFVPASSQEDGILYAPPPSHTQTPQARWTIWAALTVLLVCSLGAVLYLRYHYAAQLASPVTIGFLRVQALNNDGDLEILWDPGLFSNVKEARLDVQDGALRANMILDRRTIEAGKLAYAPKSEVIGFRLSVDRKDGMILEGSATYIAPHTPPAIVAQAKDTRDTAAGKLPAAKQDPSSTQVADRLKPAEPVAPPPESTTPAVKAPLRLAGRWTFRPGSYSKSPGVPESVAIAVTERDGAIQGWLNARYRAADSKSKEFNFSFAGQMEKSVARFPWTGKDGKRGHIEFVPISPDSVEVIFYGPDSADVYTHIVRRRN